MCLFIFIKRNTGKITLKLININGIETLIFYNFDFDHINILCIENIKLNQNNLKIKPSKGTKTATTTINYLLNC